MCLQAGVFNQNSHRTSADHTVGFGDFTGQVDVCKPVTPGADYVNRILNDSSLAAAAANAAGDFPERTDRHFGPGPARRRPLRLDDGDDGLRIAVFGKIPNRG